MANLILHEIPFELLPQEGRLLLCTAPAGFPSPAQDDMEEPIDLSAWLIDHPAASYVMRVSGHSMVGAGVADGDMVVVSRAVEARSGDIVVALVHGDRTMNRLRRRGDRMCWYRKRKGSRPSSWMRTSKFGASWWPLPADTGHERDRADRLQQLLRQL